MNIRAELSSKNKYWISKNRYYELKYFCLQYNEWKDICNALDEYSTAKALYLEQMSMVEEAAKKADELLFDFIMKAVTQGITYTELYTQYNIPCSRGTYYDRYRRFFWLLNQIKNRR